MFLSNYLPVNINRRNCSVYSGDKEFPEELLLMAHSCLTTGSQSGVVLEGNTVTFINNPDITWAVSEVYLAYNAYIVAKENNFSYYKVLDKNGNTELFVSKSFKGCRIVVNAYTFLSVLVTTKKLVAKIASMIDDKFEHVYCMNVFDIIKNLESGTAKYIPAVIINKGGANERIVFSPVQTLYNEQCTDYGLDLLLEMKQVRENHDVVTDSMKYENGKYVRHDLSFWKPMTEEHIDYLLKTYDDMLKKKSNYVEIFGEDENCHLYFSTNKRYLVNAETFECVIIKNMHTRNLLSVLASMDTAPVRDIKLAWMLAKAE